MNSLSQDSIRLIEPGLLFQGFDQSPAYPSRAGRKCRGSAPTIHRGIHVAGALFQKPTSALSVPVRPHFTEYPDRVVRTSTRELVDALPSAM